MRWTARCRGRLRRSTDGRFLRLEGANLQALFATLVGREVPEARKSSDAAFEVFTEAGATAYLDLYAAGMPPSDAQRAAGD